MPEPSIDCCGYTWPEGFNLAEDHDPRHQSCCYRETLPHTDRCAWHADPDAPDEKTIEALRDARAPPEIRMQNTPVAELLDGAVLRRMELGTEVSFESTTLRGADLTDAYLRGADLTDANLRGADLTDAYLRGADLTDGNLLEADLTDANLRSADLTDANLSRADLTDANLRSADLTDAELVEADLTDANLGAADLTDAILGSADLTDAILLVADLTDANLAWADLTDAGLSEADLTDANLQSADLTEVGLSRADLTDANLRSADLTDANLRGSTLEGATFDEGTLSNADLRDYKRGHWVTTVDGETTFKDAELRTTALPPADCLREADLSKADLEGQDLRDADLTGATLTKANLTDADLGGADLSGASLERTLLNRADLFDTRLSGARLEGAVFGDVQINDGTFEELAPDSDDETADATSGLLTRCKRLLRGPTGPDAYRCVYDPKSTYDLPEQDRLEARAAGVYHELERLAGNNALPNWQARFFFLRQDMQTRQYRKEGPQVKYWFAGVQRALFGYGESFARVLGWSSVIIGVFALVYLAGGWIHPVRAEGGLGPPITWTRLLEAPGVIWDSIYYSTLTFTALGFGDFRPDSTLGQLFTIAETATGAILLALLVFVLGRRAAR